MSLDDVRLARAYLARVAEPPAKALAAFVASVGPVDAAEAVRKGDCPQDVIDETIARRDRDRAEADLEAAGKTGARLIIPEDDEWPAWSLLCLDIAGQRGIPSAVPPLALWARGEAHLGDATEGAVAIVGARASSGYGESVAGEFAYGLVQRDLAIFSGAALGIDGAAHRGALAARGTTVALLGCALDAGYPAGHVTLLNMIAERGGLVVSEYPPGTPPARHRFLVRNRLIAALSEGTVVVEAGRRSGARNTANTAGILGKIVMAVPGPIGSATSVGCHDLIRNADATLVGSVEDVIEIVGRLGTHIPERLRPRRPTDGLGKEALRVHDALERREGKSADEIAAESGVPLQRVRAMLPALEMEGLAERHESGWRQHRRPREISEGA
ncbi:DNA-processing protein DprA [Amycolatopsis sacchari]|uniref:DNA processing protein n=1 Tax=Amycolatopsis sacchari TaxID=115433 RepID=A0A1I3ZK88_9PSEU|nr:DNA-processing protein DprA [Amycolatopsis sacchari]SFK44493.1 DNA processing protein [Amycolatopsis sacchari]